MRFKPTCEDATAAAPGCAAPVAFFFLRITPPAAPWLVEGVGTGAGVGATGAKYRPIIARFYSRILRDEIISKRKVLKGKGISIGDDLTPLNFKLVEMNC